MASLVHALYLMLTQATHGDLIRQIEYLKVENEILRNRLPERAWPTRLAGATPGFSGFLGWGFSGGQGAMVWDMTMSM